MDGNRDAAVIAVPIDYSKAFNRMLYSEILCSLSALNVPTCAIKLIKSYLTRRTMCVRYKRAVSSFKSCPGGGPQGGLLTGVLFILQVNKAGSPCNLKTPALRQSVSLPPANPETQNHISDPDLLQGTHGPLENPSTWQTGANASTSQQSENINEAVTVLPHNPTLRQEPLPLPLCHQQSKTHKKSFIDDLTLLEMISLSNLEPKSRIIGPLNFHDRFNLALPAQKSILQHQMEDIKVYTLEHHMKLNSSKTRCIPFNNSETRDFMPQIQIEEGKFLEVIYKLKLVGIVITSCLTWTAHIEYTVKRVNGAIWQLTRFKRLGAPQDKLVTFYILKIRSILMFGSICFHSSLSAELSDKLELQQRKSLAVILGSQYRSYNHARSLTNLPRLDDLREKACLQWAIKAQADP